MDQNDNRWRKILLSGGAIVGTYEGGATFEALSTALGEIRCRVVTPDVV